MALATKRISRKDTAVLIRKQLAKSFPGIKFTVRGNSYSQGSSIDVGYFDGPSVGLVEEVVRFFEGAQMEPNGGDSIKGYKNAQWDGEEVHFGTDWVHVHRYYSRTFVEAVAARLAAEHNVQAPVAKTYDKTPSETSVYSWVDVDSYRIAGFTLAELCAQEARKLDERDLRPKAAKQPKQPKPQLGGAAHREVQSGSAGVLTYTVEHDRDWTWIFFPERPSDAVIAAVRGLGGTWGWKRNGWYMRRQVPDSELQQAFGAVTTTTTTTTAATTATTPTPTTTPSTTTATPTIEVAADAGAVAVSPAEEVLLGRNTEAGDVAVALRHKADRLDARIDQLMNSGTHNQRLTRRRLGIIESQEREAEGLRRIQAALRGLADAWDDNTVPEVLRHVRTRELVEQLLLRSEMPTPNWDAKTHSALVRARIHSRTYGEARAALLQLVQPALHIDPVEKQIKDKERELFGLKIPGYFPTPKDLAQRMANELSLGPGMRVLEPSAGKGDIAVALRSAGGAEHITLEVVELQHRLREILTLKGLTIVGDDFTTFEPTAPYDRIGMNPPFEEGQDVEHVMRAYTMLAPGGRLVAIMCEGPFFRSDSQSELFRAWLELVGGDSEKLPDGSFLNGDRSTGVATRLVTIDKHAW